MAWRLWRCEGLPHARPPPRRVPSNKNPQKQEQILQIANFFQDLYLLRSQEPGKDPKAPGLTGQARCGLCVLCVLCVLCMLLRAFPAFSASARACWDFICLSFRSGWSQVSISSQFPRLDPFRVPSSSLCLRAMCASPRTRKPRSASRRDSRHTWGASLNSTYVSFLFSCSNRVVLTGCSFGAF